MDVKRVLNNLTLAGRMAHNLDVKMRDLGYSCTPYADIYCSIADSIYLILGENGDFQDSATSSFFEDKNSTVEQCADGLYSVYQLNNEEPMSSGTTMEVLKEFAAEKGIPVQSMISVILSEWALRQQYIRQLSKVV